MILYSYEYFLDKILESTQEEVERAKNQKAFVCSETRLPKQSGFRSIVSVENDCQLKKLQKNLQKNFLDKLPVCPSAKGFVKGSSYVDFLEEHIGHEYFLRMDIRNFFDSITKELLDESLKNFVQDEEEINSVLEETGYSEKESRIRKDIIELCTWGGRAPQGFLTSPAVSNLVFRRLDQRIRKYCRAYQKERKREIFYTRYADDLLFSAQGFDFKENKNFKRMIGHILADYGFSCNEKKTIYQKGQVSLSGYVIHEDVHLSRKKLRNINEVIYQFNVKIADKNIQFDKAHVDLQSILWNLNEKKMIKSDGTQISFADAGSLAHYVAGYRSFLIQIARAEHGNTGYDRRIHRMICKLEEILEYLSEEMGEA